MRNSVEPNIEENLGQALQSLAIKRQRPLLCFIGDLDEEAVEEVRDLLPQLISTDDKPARKLSVLLESPGGSAEATYRIVLGLREYVDDLEVLVPRRAKSAATLFCLAADTIHFGLHGELGPLDPQIHKLRGNFLREPALESFNALNQLLGYSLDSWDGVIKHLLDATFRREAPMDLPYVMEHAQPLFAAIVSPLFSKVDLHELGGAGLALQKSEQYAERVMKKWAYSQADVKEIRKIARRLTWGYPSHGFVIDFGEAKEIGLEAERLDPDSDSLGNRILQKTTRHIGLAIPDIDENQPDSSDATQEKTQEPHHHVRIKGENENKRSPDGQSSTVSA